MELGGKAPAIVCQDADLQTAALQCALGSFLYSGQICMATERILVNAKIADKFREVLAATIDQVFPDKNGLVLIDKTPVEKNAKLLKDAVSKGAKALYGDIGDTRELATAMRPVVLAGNPNTFSSIERALTLIAGRRQRRNGPLLHRVVRAYCLLICCRKR